MISSTQNKISLLCGFVFLLIGAVFMISTEDVDAHTMYPCDCIDVDCVERQCASHVHCGCAPSGTTAATCSSAGLRKQRCVSDLCCTMALLQYRSSVDGNVLQTVYQPVLLSADKLPPVRAVVAPHPVVVVQGHSVSQG